MNFSSLFSTMDGLILTGSSTILIDKVKFDLQQQFDMADLGLLHYFLGLQVTWPTYGIGLSQPKYALYLLSRFHMMDCKSAPTPFFFGVKLLAKCSTPLVDATLYQKFVGNLLYLSHTRLDISYVVSLVSRFMQEPHELHWKAAKRILRYIKGTHTYGIQYSSNGNEDLVGYNDSDWASDLDDHIFTSGYIFHLRFGPIVWSIKKQAGIALSSIEAEYRRFVNVATESI